MSLFKKSTHDASSPASAAEIFYSLKRSENVKHLWAHQLEMIRTVETTYADCKDLALELPTGCGKTLVGLLLAEAFRRRHRKSVLYLCPTRQLCSQVASQSEEYGIRTLLLTGSKENFSNEMLFDSNSGNAITITTYSGLFNVKPAFQDPGMVLLDDAHSAESFLSSMWTLRVNREHKEFFIALSTFFKATLSDEARRRLDATLSTSADDFYVQLLPKALYLHCLDDLSELLSKNCEGTDLFFPFSKIRDHLTSVDIFVTKQEYVFRFPSPPTSHHLPFSRASKRLYMSATLGGSGELERLLGVKTMKRISAPDELRGRSTGRRLILWPELMDLERKNGVSQLLDIGPRRVLGLTPDGARAKELLSIMSQKHKVLEAKDIESSLGPFVESENQCALILTNRYDGIDLKGDTCRKLVIHGLPIAVNVHEKFLSQRLGANSVLNDRVRTRLTQGLGRCTRDETDFSIVFMTSPDILNWFANSANSSMLLPELRAEMSFGVENSRGTSLDTCRQFIESFLARDENWAEAESSIDSHRKEIPPGTDELSEALRASAPHEVDFVYSMVNEDYQQAYVSCKKVTELLSGIETARPYRALWHYYASSAATLIHKINRDPSYSKTAIDEIESARQCCRGISWFSILKRFLDGSIDLVASYNEINYTRAVSFIRRYQGANRFSEAMIDCRARLSGLKAEAFADAVVEIGEMLGFTAKRWGKKDTGAPDGLWIAEDGRFLVFEHKTEAEAEGGISINEIRQARTHVDWVLREMPFLSPEQGTTVMVTPKKRLAADAKGLFDDCRVIAPSTFETLLDTTAPLFLKLASEGKNVPDETLLIQLQDACQRESITLDSLWTTLSGLKVSEYG